MAKAYKQLRMRLYAEDIDQSDLADRLGRSMSYVSDRINAKTPWDIRDIYIILDMLGIQEEEIHIYFPRAECMRAS